MMQYDREIKANERSCATIDIAISGDIRISRKEKEKIERYQELKKEIKRIWNIRTIKVIPVIVGAIGCTSKKLKNYIEEMGVVISTALLETARILSKVLSCG